MLLIDRGLGARGRHNGRILDELGELLVGDRERAQDVLDGDLVDVQREVLAQHLDLELVVELEVGLVVQLDQYAQHGHHPRVWRLKDLALARRLEYLRYERHHEEQLHLALLKRLAYQRLEVDVAMQDRTVLRQCDQAQP